MISDTYCLLLINVPLLVFVNNLINILYRIMFDHKCATNNFSPNNTVLTLYSPLESSSKVTVVVIYNYKIQRGF